MTRPAELAAAWWADFALVRVELGLVDSWTPAGGEWDGALFDVGLWGESYLTPNRWVDITADVQSLDLDTGRNGVDDPGEIGTASVELFDPVGAYAIAGTDHAAIGNLLRVIVGKVAAPESSCVVFHGKVTEASSIGDLTAPTTTVRALDLLGAVLSTDDAEPLPAQGVTERIAALCDRAGVPAELRELSDDGTALLAVDKAGNRLDAARGAAASSIGGTLWAAGDGVIHYRFGAFLVDPATAPAFTIGTVAGAICPASLDLAEKGADVVNDYAWSTSADAPLTAKGNDAESIRRFGRGASVRTDLLNAVQGELSALVEAELARTAWSPERVDACAVPIHDDESAALVTVQIGDLVDFAYTGAAPWSARQLIGSYAHHITPDEWSVELRAYPAIVETQWDGTAWDVGTWSLGAIAA